MDQSLRQKLLRTKAVLTRLDTTSDSDANELKRTVGLFPLTMIGVGATIGTGIFFTLAQAVPKAGPSVILSFLIAAVTAGLTALCYAELSFRIPASGSSYSFAYATVGEFAAFVMAACLLLEYGLAASATAIGWSDYLNEFLRIAVGWQIPDALRSPLIVAGVNGIEFHSGCINLPPVVLVLLCGVLLVRGTRESTTANAIMVMIKLAILVFFIAIALSGFDARNFTPFFGSNTRAGFGGMAGVTAAAGTVFFSFIGIDTIATAGDEVRNPKRNVPIAILTALVVVTVFYLFVAVAALGAQPAAKFLGQEAGLAVILQDVTGRAWPAIVLSAGAVISIFSVTLVTIYGQTRILFAMSRDGLIPNTFQKINHRSLTPALNTVIVCSLVGLIAGAVDANLLWDMVSMGTLTAFIVVAIAVPMLRRQQADSTGNGFRVPFGPYVVPALSICACLYIMKNLSAATLAVFAVWMGVAVTTYFLYGLRHSLLNKRP